ncbi:MAG TPA: hypothetical protein VKZ96_05340 [Thermomicrobiales bacterium]|nr:hypothetical protein [Thermomicrobiales bacterium]
MSEESPGREEQIADIAVKLVAYIEAQTGDAVPAPADVSADSLDAAFSALDAALDQLTDLAAVYGADRLQAIEPLVLPIAALAGEYFVHGAGATWVEPVIDADTTLIVALPGGVAVDLTGAVRASLMSGVSNLRVMAARLIAPESAP